MFGFHPLSEAPMGGFGPPPGSGGSGPSASGITMPEDVRNLLWWSAAGNVAKFQQLQAEWLAQQRALRGISDLLARYPGAQVWDAQTVLMPNGRLRSLQRDEDGNPVLGEQWTEADSRDYMASNPRGGAGGGTAGGGGGGGSSAGGTGAAADDPRYWAHLDRQFALDVQRLQAELMNMGLDADSARQQALTTLITNRNNTATDVARISADVAAQAAQFAANPRDAVAELMYRNQVGGSTPFGDLTNNNFGEYGKALAEKAASIFQPVSQDIQQARTYRDAIPPAEFFGSETRQQLGLPPTAAQSLTGGGTAVNASPQAQAPAAPNPLQALMDRLNAMTPQEQDAFRRWTSPQYRETTPLPKFDMGGVIKARTAIGDAPTSSEGGLNLNLFEPAMVVGMDSGRIYATLAEPRPDGTRRGEQLIVKPLRSEAEKDRQLAKGGMAGTQSFGVPKMQGGGTVNATPDDFMEQLRTYLGNLGGVRGGTGAVTTPLPSPRLLAGEPWERLMDDPVAMDYALAGYSSLGIDPRTIQATVRKFTPSGIQNNSPRTVWA